VPVALGGFDTFVDLTLGEVFAWPKLAIRTRVGATVRFTIAGGTSLMRGLVIWIKPP
jgi:hypothetical protein